MNEFVNDQFNWVKRNFEDADIEWHADGSAVVSFTLKTAPVEGWNKPSTKVWFVVPVGYPVAKPDCFWADPDLRLRSGVMPMSTGLNPLPIDNQVRLWFSWHATMWNPNKDTLFSYVKVIENRLRDPR